MKNIDLMSHLRSEIASDFKISRVNIQFWFYITILETIVVLEIKYEVILLISLRIKRIQTSDILKLYSFFIFSFASLKILIFSCWFFWEILILNILNSIMCITRIKKMHKIKFIKLIFLKNINYDLHKILTEIDPTISK